MTLYSKFFSNGRRCVSDEAIREEVQKFATKVGQGNVVNIETHYSDNTKITVWYWAEQEMDL